MKITLILLILLTIFSMNTFAQDFPNTIPGGGHKESINSVSFSPDGLTLASGSDDKTICLWDVATGQLKTILQGHTDRITSVVFSPNGLTLASGSWDGTIHLWDATMGEHQQTLTGHGRWVTSVVFSPDGLTLASSGGKPSLRHPNVVDGIVNLWDVATGEHQQTLIGHAGGVRSVTFNPDGTTLASGSGDATIRLWDVATGKHKTTLEGHMDDITSISFSPDGLTLASGSTYSSALHLWDVATGKHKATLKARSVTSVVFSSDGLTLANGGYAVPSTCGMLLQVNTKLPLKGIWMISLAYRSVRMVGCLRVGVMTKPSACGMSPQNNSKLYFAGIWRVSLG